MAPMNCTLGLSSNEEHRWPDTILIRDGDLKISFRRTIRVPNQDDSSTLLPPDLGGFPLFPVDKGYCDDLLELPERLRAKGGILFPMHAREALWIKIQSTDQFAVKIFVGSVNAVSGKPASQSTTCSTQDYVVTPNQRWIDGVATESGLVRQFVAVPIGHGHTVEAQLTQEERFGGIQFEVTRRKDIFRSVKTVFDGTMKVIEMEKAEKVTTLLKKIQKAFCKECYIEWITVNGRPLTDFEGKNIAEADIWRVCNSGPTS